MLVNRKLQKKTEINGHMTHHEQCMVGSLANNSNLLSVAHIESGIPVNDIDAVPGVEVGNSTITVDVERIWGQLDVDVSCNRVLMRLLLKISKSFVVTPVDITAG